MMDVRRLASALGGDVNGRDEVLCPGPGHSSRDRSLHIKISPTAPDGFVLRSYAGDHWKNCRDHVRGRLGIPPWEPGDGQRRTIPQQQVDKWDFTIVQAEANEGPRAWTDDELHRIGMAQDAWNEARDPRGTLAEKYWREARKLDPFADDIAGRVIRFHPRCPWRNERTGEIDRMPALIAAFRSVEDDSIITGVHRIRLNADATRQDRRMLGVIHRSAVMFGIAGDELTIAEGVETAAAGLHYGFAPVWALGSAGAISRFPVIEHVQRLLILMENDAKGTNARCSRICTARWRRAGKQVRHVLPDERFSDLNDVLIAEHL
jgi:putative DNA primase/helicase